MNYRLSYFIVAGDGTGDLSLEFDKLVNYLSTLDTFKVKISQNKASVFFLESGKNAEISFKEKKENVDILKDNFIQLLIEENDWESLKVLNKTIKNYNYRIFNPTLGFFITNNDNLTDLYAAPIDEKTKKIFKHFKITPLFRYENSLVYYGKSKKDGSIHLINRHLMEFLLDQEKIKGEEKEFSIKVADNISKFIALFDRGLIPISFYSAYFGKTNIVNLSGFDLEKTTQEISLTPIFFEFIEPNQSFRNFSKTPFMQEGKIRKGGSIEEYLNQIKENSFFRGKIICTKVSSDVSFEEDKNKKLIPRLTASIFLETQSN
jgi:hypothetical protein